MRADAGDHRAGAPRAAELPGRPTPSTSRPRQKLDEAGAEGPAHARRLQPRQPGRLARRVRGARRPDRPVPDGLGGAVPASTCSATRSIRSAPSTPTRQRSLYPVPEVRLLPGREFPMDEAARTAFRARWRERFEGDPTKVRALQGHRRRHRHRRHRVLPAAVLRRDRDDLRLPRRRTSTLALHGEIDEALQRFWTDTRERHRFLQHDRERPILRARGAVPAGPRSSSPLTAPHARAGAARHARRGGRLGAAGRCPTSASTAARPSRCCACSATSQATPHRVLIVAESEGRRESLLELLRDSRIEPPSVASLAEFDAGDERVAIAVAPLAEGFVWSDRDDGDRDRVHHRDRALRDAAGARAPAQAGAGQRRQRADQGPVRAQGRRPGGARQPRHRPLRRPDEHRPRRRRRRRREFLHLEYADKATLYVPVAQLHLIARYTGVSAEEAPLHTLGSGQWDKAQAQGRRAGARHRRRAAQPLRAPRRARRLRVPLPAARLRGLRGELRLRGDARPARGDPRRDPGHGLAAADGPPGLRRRRLRQDRGRAARRLRRGHRRQAGRDPGADHAARRAALPDHRRPLRQVAGEGRRAVALPLAEGSQGARSKGLADGTIDIVVGTHKLLSADVQVQAPRPADRSTRSTASACATRRR